MDLVLTQYNDFISPLASKFNVYIPDLGDSHTTRPERTEQFQAECVMAAMEAVGTMQVMGLGFVGYSMAAGESGVIACSGVCFEESDMEKVSRVMNSEHVQERRELIESLHKGRKASNVPKITQPTLIIWGEHDQIFPLELGQRLKGHLGDNAELVIVKNAGHAINAEKPKELYKNMKSFLSDHKVD